MKPQLRTVATRHLERQLLGRARSVFDPFERLVRDDFAGLISAAQTNGLEGVVSTRVFREGPAQGKRRPTNYVTNWSLLSPGELEETFEKLTTFLESGKLRAEFDHTPFVGKTYRGLHGAVVWVRPVDSSKDVPGIASAPFRFPFADKTVNATTVSIEVSDARNLHLVDQGLPRHVFEVGQNPDNVAWLEEALGLSKPNQETISAAFGRVIDRAFSFVSEA